LNRYYTMLNIIVGLDSGRDYLMQLHYNDFIKKIEKEFISVEQVEIKTYFSNLITRIYRKKFHEIKKDLSFFKQYENEWRKLSNSGIHVKEIAKQYDTSKSKVIKVLTEAQ
jgi:hypothetical protein